MTDNIIQMPTPMNVLADRIRDALARAGRSRIEWIEATLDLASTLNEARERFPSNEAFAHWLVDSKLDADMMGHQTRAALINMAADLALARIVLQETNRNSWQLIWQEEMKPRLTSASKMVPRSDKSAESSDASAPAAKSDEQPPEKPPEQSPPKLTSRSPLLHIPRGEELTAVFLGKKTRTMLGKLYHQHGGKQIITLVLEALDAGLIGPNHLESHEPTLMLLFPSAPVGFARQFRLDNYKQRKQIHELLAKMKACRDQLLAQPERMREILAEYDAAQNAKAKIEIDNNRRNEALARLPSAEQELVMFGRMVWPRVDNLQGEYDYDQIRAAIWTFRDLDNWNRQIETDNRVGSRAIRIRLTCKWLNEYLIRHDPRRENPMRRILGLIQWLSKLMELAPEAECKWPPYPSTEAEW